MSLVDWDVFILFLGCFVWGLDRHWCLKDIEKDLRVYLHDLKVGQSLAEGPIRIHYQATVSSVRTLIRNHFKSEE